MNSETGNIETHGVWIGSDERPLAAWLTRPADAGARSALLILPPIGYEYWTTQQTLRALAERLAGLGHVVLRVDYDGTGDSSGDQSDADRWSQWSAAVATGVAALRAAGAEWVGLVGLRLGGSIALKEAAAAGVDAVAVAVPVTRGRRFVRELTLLSTPVPETAGEWIEPGTIAYAGTVLAPDTVRAIAEIDLSVLPAPPAPRVLLIDREDGVSSDALAQRLEELGCELEHAEVAGVDVAMDRATEEAEVATDLVDRIAAWIGPAKPQSSPDAVIPGRTSTLLRWRDGTVREEFISLGASGLAGVATRPTADPSATVVFMNSGSEAHVGPGRAWVELSRTLALAGFQVLRVDFRGWGESPDGGFAPGRPYDGHTLEDVADIVNTLRRPGQPPVFLAGVCAGAWVALKQATFTPVDGVIAINPQLYWQPGDPVEALMSTTRKRRMPEIEYFKRCGADLELTERHPAEDWLKTLQETPIPTLVISSVGDDGVEFLESRLPRAWEAALASEVIRLATVDIDHALHQYWLRDELVGPIVDFVADASASRPVGERYLDIDGIEPVYGR